MTRSTRLFTYVFAGFALIATAACENTRAGAEKDAEIAAEEAKKASEKATAQAEQAARDAADATRQAGEKAAQKADELTREAISAGSAATTTASVKSALVADKSVDASSIDVDTDVATKVVTLKGSVPNEAQRATAERIARAKAGGYTVVNQLKIGN